MTTARGLLFPALGGRAGARIADHDWSATPLGPFGSWSATLRTTVAAVLESTHPMLLWWGAELIVLHNDAFTDRTGGRYPDALGAPGEQAFGATWPTVAPALHRMLRDEPPRAGDRFLPVDGRGPYACSPVRGDDGRVLGVLAVATGPSSGTEQAARRVTDAAAARMRAVVEGLAAIVWEADWVPSPGGGDGGGPAGDLRLTYVSDRVEEILGYPAHRLLGQPALWPQLIHRDDRDAALTYLRTCTAAGVDHDLTYRELAADGRIVWLHHVVHVVTGPDGAPVRAQGVAIDMTRHKRAERSTAVLAEAGRLAADGGDVEGKLGALARLVLHDLGDGVVASLVGPDGLLRRVAVAHDDPDVERALLALAPVRLDPADAARLADGAPLLVPASEELLRIIARDAADAAARRALGASGLLVVPLVSDGRVIGILSFVGFGTTRRFDDADVELAAELGRRASSMVSADRARRRERHLQQVSADLAAAATVAEAAQRLVARLCDILGAGAVSVYLVEPERGLRMVYATGYPPAVLSGFDLVRREEPVPLALVARTGEPEWIRNRDDWRRRWPALLPVVVADGRHAAASIPLTSGGRVVGTVGMSFDTPREFPEDERRFVSALVAQAAPTFERAAVADERRAIADTLQTSLLPSTLPRLPRLALAARYLPGAQGTRAGGDWYDVLPLDEDRVAIAVGDVVGQGARAAAVMGQLRSVLSGYLLEGHDPVRALEHLDRFAGRVPGAAGSTVACLVLDVGTGELEWASAGHLPPLMVGPDGARYLDGAGGTVLGVRGRPPFVPGRARLTPGESVLLYTDGLVERRDEVIDDGLDRLAATGGAAHALCPARLTDAVLAAAVGDTPAATALDDIAVIVARLVPPPLRLDLPAEARRLRAVRARVTAWAEATGLTDQELDDLQLALGEATANSVEHAYRNRSGAIRVELGRQGDGRLRAVVRDRGDWRPAPADRGYRGRGLDLIRRLSERTAVHHGPDGTEVSFELPVAALHQQDPAGPTDAIRTGAGSADPPPSAPARLVETTSTGASNASMRYVQVIGDLDLGGAQAVRVALLAAASSPPGGPAPDLTVDLSGVTYLASNGISLLVELSGAVAERAGGRLRLRAPAGGVVQRLLALSGIDRAVEVVQTAAG